MSCDLLLLHKKSEKMVGTSEMPSWPGGVDATSEKYREASFDGADGVVVQDQTEMFLNLNHHPVCAASDASHFLLTGAATPPGQEGRWPRSAKNVIATFPLTFCGKLYKEKTLAVGITSFARATT